MTHAQIDALIAKSVKADKSEDAIRFSQAACNVANAMCAGKTAGTIGPYPWPGLSDPVQNMYDGLSSKAASEQAQFVCKIAGETGQTILAAEHLALLVPIITETAA
jgi:hypothetical protein